MSNKYVTIVIRMPESEVDKRQVSDAMKSLDPFKTAMSLEDEMTILEMIEQHEDFDATIADDARARTIELHRDVNAVK